jgi:hypothetical protein
MQASSLNPFARALISLGALFLAIYALKIYFKYEESVQNSEAEAYIKNVVINFQGVLDHAHAKWQEVGGGPGVSMSFLGQQKNDMIFNEKGWPYGASDGAFLPQINLETRNGSSRELDLLCAQLFNNLLVATKIKAKAGKAPCKANFCVSQREGACEFTDNLNRQNSFSYQPASGTVQLLIQESTNK